MNKIFPFSLDILPKYIFNPDGNIRTSLDGDLHVHSTFSDGYSTPEEIVQKAISKGYHYIGVVDHVRRTSDWLDKFAVEMDRVKRLYSDKIQIYSGIEAKIIDLDGNIDARPEFIPQVDFILGAVHRLPKGTDEYFSSDEILSNNEKALDCWFKGFTRLLENPDVHMIAHPTATLTRHNIKVPKDMKGEISKKAAFNSMIIEINTKYKVPDNEFIRLLQLHNVKISIGSDSHHIDDM